MRVKAHVGKQTKPDKQEADRQEFSNFEIFEILDLFSCCFHFQHERCLLIESLSDHHAVYGQQASRQLAHVLFKMSQVTEADNLKAELQCRTSASLIVDAVP